MCGGGGYSQLIIRVCYIPKLMVFRPIGSVKGYAFCLKRLKEFTVFENNS